MRESMDRMRGKIKRPMRLQHDGVTRWCWCEDCYPQHQATRASEKRTWKRAVVRGKEMDDA